MASMNKICSAEGERISIVTDKVRASDRTAYPGGINSVSPGESTIYSTDSFSSGSKSIADSVSL